jgi:ATP-binding cassette subfamily B protein
VSATDRRQRPREAGGGKTADPLASRYQAFRFAWSVFPRRDRPLLAWKLLSEISLSLLAAVPPLLVRELLDRVLPARDVAALTVLVLAGAVVYALLAVAGVADQWLQSRIGEGLGLALRSRFFAKVVGLPFAFFVHSRSGSLVSRLTVDVRVAQGILQSSGSVFSSGMTFVVTLGIMAWLSPLVTLVTLAVLPLVVVVDRGFSRRIAAQSRRKLATYSVMTSYAAERTNAGGALLIRTAGDPEDELTGFAQRSGDVWRAGIRSAVLSRSYYGVLAIFAAFGILAVLYLGGRLAIAGSLRLGTLVALTQYASRSYQPVTSIARTRMRILDAAVALNRIRQFLDAPVAPPPPVTAGADRTPAPEVELDDVWFRYPEVRVVPGSDADTLPVVTDGATPWILRGVSFRAGPGTKTAIVGESGAGKTSIGYLLAGLFGATRGTVRLGGSDIADLSAGSVRQGVGLVTQEAFLFSGTLAENVRYGRRDASDAEVVEACRTAGIHETVEALPDGYQTVVGERGYRLSGGQKQRISLARALLCRCPVIVLDEATSHLDTGMDERIQRDLCRDLPDRVLIVMAHRLSTVVDADQILVLRDGVLVERGRHDDLAGAGGHYAALFRTWQAGAGPPDLNGSKERTLP